jgi:hypothetical protein
MVSLLLPRHASSATAAAATVVEACGGGVRLFPVTSIGTLRREMKRYVKDMSGHKFAKRGGGVLQICVFMTDMKRCKSVSKRGIIKCLCVFRNAPMLTIPDTKMLCRDQFCVATTEACRRIVPTFGCQATSPTTCRQHCQPSHTQLNHGVCCFV